MIYSIFKKFQSLDLAWTSTNLSNLKKIVTHCSSVSRRGRGEAITLSSLTGQSKFRIRKIPPFQLFWDCFLRWNGLKSDLKHLLKHLFGRRANLSKIKVTNKWKLWKMPKTKQSNLIASVKDAKHRLYQQIYSKLRNKGGQCSVSYSPITSLKYFSISPPIIFLCKIKTK